MSYKGESQGLRILSWTYLGSKAEGNEIEITITWQRANTQRVTGEAGQILK